MDNNRPTAKKPWQKPELIVLVRSKPEESVLITCKNAGAAGPTNKNKCTRAGGCHVIGNS